jgi:hypothetical protein
MMKQSCGSAHSTVDMIVIQITLDIEAVYNKSLLIGKSGCVVVWLMRYSPRDCTLKEGAIMTLRHVIHHHYGTNHESFQPIKIIAELYQRSKI